ncbi:hypothetical protein TNCV_2079331 [Trichonephila clavipes]|nr:hypothetical protein TNCV_2079331 [Trichonephila clavipes]
MLKRVIVTEWNIISSEETSKLVQSMPKRLTEVLRHVVVENQHINPPEEPECRTRKNANSDAPKKPVGVFLFQTIA